MGPTEDEQVFLDGAYVTLANLIVHLDERISRLRSAPSVGTVQD